MKWFGETKFGLSDEERDEECDEAAEINVSEHDSCSGISESEESDVQLNSRSSEEDCEDEIQTKTVYYGKNRY